MKRNASPPGTERVPERDRGNALKIEYRAIDKLYQAGADPRRFSRRDRKKAESIIRRFGVKLPLPIANDGRVLAHYHIVAAARSLGLDELPVVIVEEMSEGDRSLLSLALNRLYELGSFDEKLLGDLVIEIEVHMPEINYEDFGFEPPEIDRALGARRKRAAEQDEQVVTGPPVCKLGDVWILDQHRVGCFDSTEATSYDAILENRRAHMVFADPPYGCRVKDISSRNHAEFLQGSAGRDDPALHYLLANFSRLAHERLEAGCLTFICSDWRCLPHLLRAAEPYFGEPANVAVWVKDRAGMGSLYRSQHELIPVFAKPGATVRNNVQLGRHGRNRSNVWSYPSAMTFGQQGAEGDLLEDHPTPKPKDLVADAILDCTARGEVVLDPFLGSGSTLIAAEMTGRDFAGMDLNPIFVDLSIRRWQAWTGRQARHAVTGQMFDDIASTPQLLLSGEEA